jgi:hypothetical protein
MTEEVGLLPPFGQHYWPVTDAANSVTLFDQSASIFGCFPYIYILKLV